MTFTDPSSELIVHQAPSVAQSATVRGSGHARTVLETVEAFLRRCGGGRRHLGLRQWLALRLRRARSAAPRALCAQRNAESAVQPAVGHRAHGSVRALGGSPPSLMKPGFLVHSPCVTHVSHLMSSSAHVPLPALAASATSHQPHARWHVVALPATQEPNAASAQGALPRASGVAHMKRRLRTQCSSLAHPAHFDVVSLHDGSAGWRSATAGRREAGEAGAERHALQLRRHSAHHAHAALSGAAGGRLSSARFGLWAAAHLPS
eukprot:scaffold66629_cov70-Phaeocystis_antarctica.AAC.1